MKKTLRRVLALMLVLVMAVGLVACKKPVETPPEAGDRTVIYYAAAYVDAQMQDAYNGKSRTSARGASPKSQKRAQRRRNDRLCASCTAQAIRWTKAESCNRRNNSYEAKCYSF